MAERTKPKFEHVTFAFVYPTYHQRSSDYLPRRPQIRRSLRHFQHKFDDDETIAMVDQRSLKVIKDNPIGKGLDGFCASFNVMCEGASIFCSPDALELLSQEGKIVGLASLWRALLTIT
jgi:hypothetical protein